MGKILVVHIAWRTIQFLNFLGGNLLMYNICRWACLWILHPHIFHTLFECRVSGAKDCGTAQVDELRATMDECDGGNEGFWTRLQMSLCTVSLHLFYYPRVSIVSTCTTASFLLGFTV